MHEIGEIDPRYGRVLNNDLAEYPVPVNADTEWIDVDVIDEPDIRLNISGVKRAGEVAMVGAAAAIANAVFNATGKRIRHLPIRIEDLLQGPLRPLSRPRQGAIRWQGAANGDDPNVSENVT